MMEISAGTLPLAYVKLKEDISKKDLEFFIENGAKNAQIQAMNAC